MRRQLDPFFDCRLLWSMDELRDPAPYVIFEDDQSAPFARDLIAAGQLDGSLVSVTRSIEDLRATRHPVFMEAPVWERRHADLRAVGVHGERARVLLYFDKDPTGYWDFARACGPQLRTILQTRRLDRAAMDQLGPYLEKWLGARSLGGRLLPMSAFVLRDYREEVSSNLAAIFQVMSRLADEESRATYTRMLMGTNEDLLGRFAEKVFGPQQYMEIVDVKPGDVIVNCGVESGWELPYFLCRLQGRGRIFNFDPNIAWDETRYAGFIARFAGLLDERRIILGARDGVVDLPMTDRGMVRPDDVGAAMAAQGAPTEPYVSQRLDTLAENGTFERIDYLKMDVEGGEGEILRGGMETIRRFRPKLAVAIYHEPRHFWEYPAMLMEQLEDYRFYVRQYGYSRFETLLYATPLEDAASGSRHEGLRRPQARPAPPWEVEVAAHLRDRAPRAYYGGGRRLLTRLCGTSLEAAAIDPAPTIDADAVAAVFEDKESRLYVATHQFGPGDRQLVVGRSRQAADIRWFHTQGVADCVCAPAPGPDGAPGYGLFDPASGAVAVYAIAGDEVAPVMSFAIPSAPALIQRHGDGSAAAFLVEATGRALRRLDYDAAGNPVGGGSRLKLAGEWAGFVSTRKTGDRARRAIAVTTASGSIQVVDALGRPLAELEADDRFKLIATLRDGEAHLPVFSEHPQDAA